MNIDKYMDILMVILATSITIVIFFASTVYLITTIKGVL